MPTRTGKPTKQAYNFLNLITQRITKIRALAILILSLILAILNYSKQIKGKVAELGWYSPPPCVEIEPLIVPRTIKFNEWENMNIMLKGRNNCSKSLGIYVQFQPRVPMSKPRLRLRGPHDTEKGCEIPASSRAPFCWDTKIPVSKGKGNFTWPVPPPPLEKLGDLRPVEKISVNWYVYDYDAPDKSPLASDCFTIEIYNDTTKVP